MKHIDLETIRHYESNMMSEQETAAVDEHLAGCQECVDRVWAHHYVHDHFDEVWEEFSSGRLFKESLDDRRMIAADGEPLAPELKARAKALMADLKAKAAAVIKVVLDVSGKTAEVFDGGLELLGLDKETFSFSPVAAPVRVLGEEQKSGIALEAQGPPPMRVVVDPASQRISIMMGIVEPPWPIVVLHLKATDTRMVAEFRHPEGTDYLLAELEDLPSGEFSLTWERSGSHEKIDP